MDRDRTRHEGGSGSARARPGRARDGASRRRGRDRARRERPAPFPRRPRRGTRAPARADGGHGRPGAVRVRAGRPTAVRPAGRRRRLGGSADDDRRAERVGVGRGAPGRALRRAEAHVPDRAATGLLLRRGARRRRASRRRAGVRGLAPVRAAPRERQLPRAARRRRAQSLGPERDHRSRTDDGLRRPRRREVEKSGGRGDNLPVVAHAPRSQAWILGVLVGAVAILFVLWRAIGISSTNTRSLDAPVPVETVDTDATASGAPPVDLQRPVQERAAAGAAPRPAAATTSAPPQETKKPPPLTPFNTPELNTNP